MGGSAGLRGAGLDGFPAMLLAVTVLWVGILALFYFTGTPPGPGTTIGIG